MRVGVGQKMRAGVGQIIRVGVGLGVGESTPVPFYNMGMQLSRAAQCEGCQGPHNPGTWWKPAGHREHAVVAPVDTVI